MFFINDYNFKHGQIKAKQGKTKEIDSITDYREINQTADIPVLNLKPAYINHNQNLLTFGKISVDLLTKIEHYRRPTN